MGGHWRDEGGDVVVVAMDATKEINVHTLEWTVRNVIKPADTLILLAILPRTSSNQAKSKGHSRIHRFFASLLKKWGLYQEKEWHGRVGARGDEEAKKINAACEDIMKQLCLSNHVTRVETHVEIISDAWPGAVASKALGFGASWVILDERLKREGDYCLKQLICNVIVIDHAIPKTLRLLNTRSIANAQLIMQGSRTDLSDEVSRSHSTYWQKTTNGTPASSLGLESNGSSKLDHSGSFPSTDQELDKQAIPLFALNSQSSEPFHPESLTWKSKCRDEIQYPIAEMTNKCKGLQEKPPKHPAAAALSISQTVIAVRSSNDLSNTKIIDRTSSIRKAMSLSIKQPPTPPPLCSMCQHRAPIFGKPPRKFSYRDVEIATDGFSRTNFLAEGGYGPVYKGVLPDGQMVVVKQHKVVSAQGASEFCTEVEVLSCAQHRNLVMLVGYCTEEWLLVYEFACNGSLDTHLYGKGSNEVMAWENRLKVATGAARGLRYLHEDCQVGCIVHRDLRPNNILLTHDFEAMVGDFGLARWLVNGQSAEETRVIGTFGYLAPEYTQTGQITEKADVYAFGVLLLELLSGLRAIELGASLLERKKVCGLMDPRLQGNYVQHEAACMMHAARLCSSRDPDCRPRMSKVLRILEGETILSGDQVLSHPPCTTRVHGKVDPAELKGNPTSSPGGSGSKTRYMDHKLERVLKSEPLNPRPHESLASEEYQAYLRESLAEFIVKMKKNSDRFGMKVRYLPEHEQ